MLHDAHILREARQHLRQPNEVRLHYLHRDVDRPPLAAVDNPERPAADRRARQVDLLVVELRARHSLDIRVHVDAELTDFDRFRFEQLRVVPAASCRCWSGVRTRAASSACSGSTV